MCSCLLHCSLLCSGDALIPDASPQHIWDLLLKDYSTLNTAMQSKYMYAHNRIKSTWDFHTAMHNHAYSHLHLHDNQQQRPLTAGQQTIVHCKQPASCEWCTDCSTNNSYHPNRWHQKVASHVDSATSCSTHFSWSEHGHVYMARGTV